MMTVPRVVGYWEHWELGSSRALSLCGHWDTWGPGSPGVWGLWGHKESWDTDALGVGFLGQGGPWEQRG